MAKTKSVQNSLINNLNSFLSSTFVLYVKTLNFHWNLVGEQFYMHHKLLEEQYKELAGAIDEIAERLRMLDHSPASSMKEFLSLADLKEAGTKGKDQSMIKELSKDHRTLVNLAKELVTQSDKNNDPGTSDLLIQRIRAHDKAAWILESHL